MQETLYQTADEGNYHTANAGVSQRMQRLSIRQRMQETLYQTADAGESLSDSGWRLSIRQRTLYQTADAGDSLSDSDDAGELSIRQRMQR